VSHLGLSFAEGLELDEALVEPLVALHGVVQDELKPTVRGIDRRFPAKNLIGCGCVNVFSDNDVPLLTDEPMLFDELVAQEKVVVKVGLELPEDFRRSRDEVDEFVCFAAPRLGLNPIEHFFVAAQLLRARLHGGRLDRESPMGMHQKENQCHNDAEPCQRLCR